MVHIELVYIASNKETVHLKLVLPDDSTVSEAISRSNLYKLHPETEICPIGVFGKLVSLHTKLMDGDRVELYRPLVIDPKEKRRKLARTRLKKK